VIVIVAAMASFALVNYNKSMLIAHERDAVMHLKTIHAANMIHFAKDGGYWPPDANNYELSEINTGLNLFIMSGDVTYSCSGSDGTTFDCQGDYISKNKTYVIFEVSIDEENLSSSNPCCSSAAGVCPTLSNCS